MWVNTVGPFKNPTETYSYFEKLPVCHPDVIQHRRETLGEVMEGNRLVEAGYDVHFRGTVACSRGPVAATRSAAALTARTGALASRGRAARREHGPPGDLRDGADARGGRHVQGGHRQHVLLPAAYRYGTLRGSACGMQRDADGGAGAVCTTSGRRRRLGQTTCRWATLSAHPSRRATRSATTTCTTSLTFRSSTTKTTCVAGAGPRATGRPSPNRDRARAPRICAAGRAQIVRANLTNADMRESYIDIDENIGREIKFYYSVVWSENPTYGSDASASGRSARANKCLTDAIAWGETPCEPTGWTTTTGWTSSCSTPSSSASSRCVLPCRRGRTPCASYR